MVIGSRSRAGFWVEVGLSLFGVLGGSGGPRHRYRGAHEQTPVEHQQHSAVWYKDARGVAYDAFLRCTDQKNHQWRISQNRSIMQSPSHDFLYGKGSIARAAHYWLRLACVCARETNCFCWVRYRYTVGRPFNYVYSWGDSEMERHSTNRRDSVIRYICGHPLSLFIESFSSQFTSCYVYSWGCFGVEKRFHE